MFMTTSLIKSLPSYSVQESTSDPLPVSEGLGAGLRIPTTKFINVIEWPVLDTHTNIVYKMFMFEKNICANYQKIMFAISDCAKSTHILQHWTVVQ